MDHTDKPQFDFERAQSNPLGGRPSIRGPRLLQFFGFFLTTAALGALVVSGLMALTQYNLLSSWARAQARIVSSELYSTQYWANGARSTMGYWHTSYGFRCIVEYTANGRRYESTADLGLRTTGVGAVARWPERLPPGTSVVVAYDPADPTQVRLAGDYRMTYAKALIGMPMEPWMLLAGVTLLSISRRLLRSADKAAPASY
jgi:hypothetical protein